jgi:hypothetical protein
MVNREVDGFLAQRRQGGSLADGRPGAWIDPSKQTLLLGNSIECSYGNLKGQGAENIAKRQR